MKKSLLLPFLIYLALYTCTASPNCVPLPTFVTVSASATVICSGVIDTFTAVDSNVITPTYQWYKNGLAIGTDTSVYTDVALNNNDSIWLVMTGMSTCGLPVTDTSAHIIITVHPTPPLVTLSWDSLVEERDLVWSIYLGDTFWSYSGGCGTPQIFPLIGGSPSGGSYSGVNVYNDTISFQSWNFSQNTKDTIYYTYTNVNGCSATAIDSFGVTHCDGIAVILNETTISLYPNPNNGSFILQSNDGIGKEYIISDMVGKIISQQSITSDDQNMQLQNISAGTYMLQIKGSSSKAIRFTVE